VSAGSECQEKVYWKSHVCARLSRVSFVVPSFLRASNIFTPCDHSRWVSVRANKRKQVRFLTPSRRDDSGLQIPEDERSIDRVSLARRSTLKTDPCLPHYSNTFDHSALFPAVRDRIFGRQLTCIVGPHVQCQSKARQPRQPRHHRTRRPQRYPKETRRRHMPPPHTMPSNQRIRTTSVELPIDGLIDIGKHND
jgi:hypothetical protein